MLGPLVAKQSLGGASAWAAVIAAWGVGSVLGDLIGLRYEPRRPLLVAFATLALAVPEAILIGTRAPPVAIVSAGLFYGIAWSFPNVLWFTALQENVPPASLSRVSSYDWMGSMALRPIGYAAVGTVAASFGVGPTLVGGALLYATAVAATLSVPSIAAVERRRGGRGAQFERGSLEKPCGVSLMRWRERRTLSLIYK